jgi:hypothetical protein
MWKRNAKKEARTFVAERHTVAVFILYKSLIHVTHIDPARRSKIEKNGAQTRIFMTEGG